MRRTINVIVAVVMVFFVCHAAGAAYKPTESRQPGDGEVAVDKPGSYAESGKTYVLTKDISSPMTPIFLGNNVTLDLNGHTVTFADGGYEHIPNYGFEEDLKYWDIAKAPGAKAVSTVVRPLVGKKLCKLPEGQEIVSQYINLPVANRSYYATVTLANSHGDGSWKGHRISLYVEDENGKQVECVFKGGSKPRVEGKLENRHCELGGGTLFTHLFYLPAGKYRLRVKAAKGECEIDECDIRPALDAGIAVMKGPDPWCTYNDVMSWYPCAFFDYNKKNGRGVAVDGVPLVRDTGTITIKNGVVKSGYEQGIRSWGIHSNAKNVTLVLENVKVVNSGINAGAVNAACATIRNCRFEADNPFIINRHDTSEMNVRLGKTTEVSFSEFVGGQGCLSTGKGGGAKIHDNIFRNGQTVTNHYTISPGPGDKIYKNRFEPIIGSGIYIGSRNVEVYENEFVISSSPPNAEYRYAGYSTNAIRISDYNSGKCTDNKVYKNKIKITGLDYPKYDNYTPKTYGFFISNGGGGNQVYDNEIIVENKGKKVRALAFFVSSSNDGGDIYSNRIISNVLPVQFGGDYGSTRKAVFRNNTIVRVKGAPEFKPIRVCKNASGVVLKGNKFENCKSEVDGGGQYTME